MAENDAGRMGGEPITPEPIDLPVEDVFPSTPESLEALAAKRAQIKGEVDQLTADYTRLRNQLTSEAPTEPGIREAQRKTLGIIDSTLTQLTTIDSSIADADEAQLDALEPLIKSKQERLAEFIDAATPEQEAPEDGEASDPVNPVTPERRYRARQTLGALSGADVNVRVDAEITQRVNEALEAIGGEPAPLSEMLIDEIVAKIKTRWNKEDAQHFTGASSREILEATIAHLTRDPADGNEAMEIDLALQDFDHLVRQAVVDHVIMLRTKDIREKIRAQITKVEKRNTRTAKVMRGAGQLLLGVGAGALGSWIRNGLIQGGVANTAAAFGTAGAVAGARTLSGLSGLAAGAVTGGIIGGITGYNRARSETFSFAHIDSEIKKYREKLKESKEKFSEDEEIGLLISLVREGKLTGQSTQELEAAQLVIENYYIAQKEKELQAALAIIDSDPSAEERTPEENLAIAMTALLDKRLNGSEITKTANMEKFVVERYKEIKGKTWRAIGLGALTGAGLGGVLGAVFPSSTLIGQISTEQSIQHDTLKPLANAIGLGDTDAVQRIAKDLHLDLTAKYGAGGDQRLIDLAKQLLLRPDGSYASVDENTMRALHHLLSHPGEIAPHIDALREMLANGHFNGHDFSWRVLHGQYLNGANYGDLGKSIYDHFKGTKGHDLFAQEWYKTHNPLQDFNRWTAERVMPFGTEQGWEHFLGFMGATWGARFVSGHGWGAVDRLEKTALEYQKNIRLGKEPELKWRPKTATVEFDKRALSPIDPALPESVQEKLERSREKIGEMVKSYHGYFVFNYGPDGKPHAYRLWPLNTAEANPNRNRGSKHAENNPDAGEDLRPNDPDAINSGRFYVKEYEIDSLFETDKDGRYVAMPLITEDKNDRYSIQKFRDTWSVPKWKPVTKSAKKVDWKTVFQARGEQGHQVVISPYEVDKYAFAVKRLGLRAGQYRSDINKFVEQAPPAAEVTLPPDPISPKPTPPTPAPKPADKPTPAPAGPGLTGASTLASSIPIPPTDRSVTPEGDPPPEPEADPVDTEDETENRPEDAMVVEANRYPYETLTDINKQIVSGVLLYEPKYSMLIHIGRVGPQGAIEFKYLNKGNSWSEAFYATETDFRDGIGRDQVISAEDYARINNHGDGSLRIPESAQIIDPGKYASELLTDINKQILPGTILFNPLKKIIIQVAGPASSEGRVDIRYLNNNMSWSEPQAINQTEIGVSRWQVISQEEFDRANNPAPEPVSDTENLDDLPMTLQTITLPKHDRTKKDRMLSDLKIKELDTIKKNLETNLRVVEAAGTNGEPIKADIELIHKWIERGRFYGSSR